MPKLLAPTAKVSAYRLKAFCYVILMHLMPMTYILYDLLLNIIEEICLRIRHCILCSSDSMERKLKSCLQLYKAESKKKLQVKELHSRIMT
jgi:lipid A disaccharide synthetase